MEKGYFVNAITPEEYEEFGPVELFRNSFEDAWSNAKNSFEVGLWYRGLPFFKNSYGEFNNSALIGFSRKSLAPSFMESTAFLMSGSANVMTGM